MTKEEIRVSIIRHIQGVNKHLTTEHLEGLEFDMLLANAHPVYREDYKKLWKEASKEETKVDEPEAE